MSNKNHMTMSMTIYTKYRIQNTLFWLTKTQMIDTSARLEPIANLANHEASRNRGRESRFEGKDTWSLR